MKTKLRNLWKLKEYIYNHKIYAILIVVLALAKVSTGLMTIHLLGALIDSVVDRSTNLPALLLSFSFNHIYDHSFPLRYKAQNSMKPNCH